MKSFTISYEHGEPVRISINGGNAVAVDNKIVECIDKFFSIDSEIHKYENIIKSFEADRNKLLDNMATIVMQTIQEI